MTLDQVLTATLDELLDELAAAGLSSERIEIHQARQGVALMLMDLDLVSGEHLDLKNQMKEIGFRVVADGGDSEKSLIFDDYSAEVIGEILGGANATATSVERCCET